jgi:protein-tyrosine phosphatase
MRHLPVEGGFNIRDLGGYATQDGRVTRLGVLIRAGNLSRVSPAGAQQLLGFGIRTIIDIRDEGEVEKHPDVFAQSLAVKYANLPFIGTDLSSSERWKARTQTYAGLDRLYEIFLDACQPQVAAIITALAESEPAAVFHCHAGKDRTGVVSALLLGAAGVPAQVIADDYAETSRQITEQVAGWRAAALKQGQDMQAFERDTGAVAATMLHTLDHLERRYGGATNYLLQCGVSQRQLNELLARFVL